MKISINKQYLLLVIILYTLVFNELLSSLIPLFQYEDEILAVLAIPMFGWNVLLRRKDNTKTGAVRFILGFTLLAIVSSMVFGYQGFFKAAIPDLLLCLKFWLSIYTSKCLFKEFDLIRFAPKIANHVKWISVVFFALSIANLAFELFPYEEYRFGMMSNRLFYSHPVTLAAMCAFLIVVLVALKPHTNNIFWCVGILIAVMCTTLRAKALGSALMFVVVYLLLIVRKQKFSYMHLLAMIPGILVIGWTQIEYYFVTMQDVSARAQLWITSFKVAADHFPFGAGLATYGSYYSAVYYSPLYFEYGLDTIHGLSQNGSQFICDSFWPMILAQSGWFGAILYGAAIVVLLKKLFSIKKEHLYFAGSGIMVMCYMLIESIASIAFAHPNAMLFAVWVGVLLCSKRLHRGAGV